MSILIPLGIVVAWFVWFEYRLKRRNKQTEEILKGLREPTWKGRL